MPCQKRWLVPWLSAALLVAALPVSAEAYQARIQQPNVVLRSVPDLRHGKELQRLGPQRVGLLNCVYASDNAIWCLVRPAQGSAGWTQARLLAPTLNENFPLRLADLPALLLFETAQSSLQQHTAQASNRRESQRALLTLDMALMKQRWEALRHRLNFLEISKRAHVPVSATEMQQVQAELKVLEQRFQHVLAEWQRLPS